MSDPKRLMDAMDGSPEERELLRAAGSEGLPATDRRAIWASIEASVALTAATAKLGSTAGGSGSSATTVGAIGLGKVVALGAVTLALGAGGYALLRSPGEHGSKSAHGDVATRPLPSFASSAPAAPPSEVVPALAASNGASGETVAASPNGAANVELRRAEPAPSPRPSASSTASLLREESLAVLSARQALKGGDYGAALKQIEEMRHRFPRGALSQEREALSIEALAKSGAGAAAARRARAFLQRYPKSPYAADVERYAAP